MEIKASGGGVKSPEEKWLEQGWAWLESHPDHPRYQEFRTEWDRRKKIHDAQGGPRKAQIYAQLEERAREVEVDDQRRIAAGETAPWLGKRTTWLTG